MLIFARGLVLGLYLVVLGAEINSASNGVSFKEVTAQKWGFCHKYSVFDFIQLVILADIRSSTCVGSLLSSVGCRI